MKEALLRLKGDKKINVDFDVVVKNTIVENELDLIEVDIEENNILFEKLSLFKGEIFPLPKSKNILKVKELFIDFDERLDLRLFIKSEIRSSLDNNCISNNYNAQFSFSNNQIIESLKNICGIKENLFSSIFKLDSIQEKYYNLLCLKDFNTYKISSENMLFTPLKNEFILIANYIIENNNNEIIMSNFTIIKKLEEEKLFQFFYKPDIFGNKLTLFKVIDINEKYYIVINNKNELYQIERSLKLETFDIKICQILLIKNFKLIYNLNTYLNNISLDNNSIVYISTQGIYFCKLIPINLLSVIYINFLDYDNKNFYNKISINEHQFIINDKEAYYVIPNMKNNCDFYIIEIILQKLEDNNSKKFFNFFLYKGVLNKINAFINYYSEKTYFIEYYFMSVDLSIKDAYTNTNIQINDKLYELNYFDIFQSENRKRINALNVPYQEIEKFKENVLVSKNINSIQICKIFHKKKGIIYGIFNIKEAISREVKYDDTYFDQYYNNFGDVLSLLENNDINLDKKKEICIKKFNDSKINKSEEVITSIFNNKLTRSQFKTRMGLIICHYFNKSKNEYDSFIVWQIWKKIKNYINNITFSQILRIFILLLRKNMENFDSIDIIFFSSLSKNSPYVLAKELNKQEIINLTEFSRYFIAYLQLNSDVMYNYLKSEESFSFSLKILFVMKHLLLSNYDDFIATTIEYREEYAYNTINENITLINEHNIFPYNFDPIKDIEDIEESKNLALPLSIEIRNQRNSLQKYNYKNYTNFPSLLFYRDGNIEIIQEIEKSDNNSFITGRIIDSFLSSDKYVIWELKNFHKFGELLNYEYFVDRDFSKLLKKMEEIKRKGDIKNELENELKNVKFDNKGKYKRILNKKLINERYKKKLEEEGIIKFGDIHYTKYEFEKILQKNNKK